MVEYWLRKLADRVTILAEWKESKNNVTMLSDQYIIASVSMDTEGAVIDLHKT